MRKFVTVSGFLVLASCIEPTSFDMYWKENALPATRQGDLTDCEVQALNRVPTAMAVGTTPVYTTPTYVTPAYTNCYGTGYGASCTTTGGNVSGGQVYGGNVYSYDANAELRSRVISQCMGGKGYADVTVPACTAEQKKLGVVPRLSQRTPPLKNVLCLTADGYVLAPS